MKAPMNTFFATIGTPPHEMLSIAFQWIGFVLAGLLLIQVLLIGLGHFRAWLKTWWKEQHTA
jgi:hypothetical protein